MNRWMFSTVRPLMLLALLFGIPACNGSLDTPNSDPSGSIPGGIGPAFGGLASATAGAASGQVILSWGGAADPSGTGITYLVFQSNAGAGMEDLSGPLYTTTNPTSLVISGLLSHLQYWFIVQARDGNGRTDGNLIEQTVIVP
jgi:hypothetical protein